MINQCTAAFVSGTAIALLGVFAYSQVKRKVGKGEKAKSQ